MSQYMYLGTLIGTRFGGADAGKFKLPDLQSRNPTNCRYMVSVDGQDPVGDMPWDPFVGEIRLLPYEAHEASRNRWRLCDGGQFAPNESPALAHLLGKRFYLALMGMMPPRG